MKGRTTLTEATDVLLAWSGGKDSALALAALRADPAWRVVGLLTTITGDYDRISIHGVRRAVLDAQVAAVGLPLFEATIPAAASNAAYEAAFTGALAQARARTPGLRHVALHDPGQFRHRGLEPVHLPIARDQRTPLPHRHSSCPA